MGSQNLNSSTSATTNPSLSTETALIAMAGFVTWVFDLSAEHLPNEEAVERRAKAWLKLLTPHFFKRETSYVVQVCSRLRGDRRDAIKADEILRIAEKVYGCPVAVWGNPDYSRDPQVWSATDNDWISLDRALERLWAAQTAGKVFEDTYEDLLDRPKAIRKRFEQARPQLLALIYGGE